MDPKRQRGFTLIEAMVVVALLAIVGAIAAPSFRSFIATMNSKSAAFDLINDLSLARSEAIKLNANVQVVPIGSDWAKGWRVMQGANVLHVEAKNSGELRQVIRIAAGADQSQHIAATNARSLLLVEAEFLHVSLLVTHKLVAASGRVERETHFVERIAFAGLSPVKEGGAGDRRGIAHGSSSSG